MNDEPEVVQIKAYKMDMDWLKETSGSFDLTDRLHEVIILYRRHVVGEKV